MKLTSAVALLLRVTLPMSSYVEQLYDPGKTSMFTMMVTSVIILSFIASCVPVPIRGFRAVIRLGDHEDDYDLNLNIDIYRIHVNEQQ